MLVCDKLINYGRSRYYIVHLGTCGTGGGRDPFRIDAYSASGVSPIASSCSRITAFASQVALVAGLLAYSGAMHARIRSTTCCSS